MTTLHMRLPILVVAMALASNAFVHHSTHTNGSRNAHSLGLLPSDKVCYDKERPNAEIKPFMKQFAALASTAALATALVFSPFAASAENELADKYGGKGFDSSLVDQNCLVDKCSVQAKACLAEFFEQCFLVALVNVQLHPRLSTTDNAQCTWCHWTNVN